MVELKKIQDFVKDKNILLVGNSEKLKYNNYKHLIDSFDIVVRMNHAVTERYNFIGNKTDIWICNFNKIKMQISRLNQFNPLPKLIIRFAGWHTINKKLADKDNFYIWNKESYLGFQNLYFEKMKPSTGSTAIYFFNTYTNPKSLTIVGFDFFKRNTFYMSGDMATCHNADKEKEFILEQIKNEKVSIL